MSTQRRLSPSFKTICIGGWLALTPLALHAEAVRLRLFGPGTASSAIQDDARLSPDGEWAVARWDVFTSGVYQLYAVRRDGTEGHQLSPPGAFSVESFEISSDSRYVVYECERLSDGVRELRSVPISGPAFEALLSPAWTAGDGVAEYAISPNSSRVVVRGAFDVDGIDELWSAPIAGPTGASVKLNPPPVLNGEVDLMSIAPNSARVVFFGDVAQAGRPEYWSVPIAGPGASALRLNPAPPAGASMSGAKILITPDSARVLYSGHLDVSGANELWSVPLAGPAASSVKLNPAPVAGGTVMPTHLTLTPDGARAVFHGDLRVDERFEIWSVPVAGPAANAVRLNPTPVAGGEINNADPFLVSPDSTYLVMHGDLASVGAHELWRVPIAGPATSAVKVNPTPIAGGEIGVGDYEISPDSARIVFSGNLVTTSRVELWSASRSAAAGVAANLSTISATPGDVVSFRISGDSSRVVFRGDLVAADKFWLFGRDIDGTGSRDLFSSELLFLPDADVGRYAVSPDGRDVVYEANPDDPTRTELYRRRVADGSKFEHLSGPNPAFTDASLIGITADSRGSLYLADASFAGADQLWIADDCILRANFEEGDTSEWSSAVP